VLLQLVVNHIESSKEMSFDFYQWIFLLFRSPGISMQNGIISDRLSPHSPQYFDHLLAYGQSKLCLIMFIAELRRNYPRAFLKLNSSVTYHEGTDKSL